MEKFENLFLPTRNFAGLTSPYCDFSNARVVILPVPYDGTTEWHSGTRYAPQAIIDASQYLELYDLELGREIHRVGIHTLRSLQPSLENPRKMIERVSNVASELIKQEKFPVMLGGEHSLSLGMVQALKENFSDFCVLQLDAHADLRDEYLDTKYSHACVMRRIHEICPIIQVGIRSLSSEENQFLTKNKMHPYYISTSSTDLPPPEDIVRTISEHVYVSIDLDVFDPSVIGAVGTPEPGGMHWFEVLNLLRCVSRNKHVIGFDLVELCPGINDHSATYLAAKLAYKFIGYAVPA
jgi:N1-aminopropylagmatine ureohydrolase